MDLRWFNSVNTFLSATSLGQSTPAALVLDGVVPRNEEANWISTLMRHPGSRQARVIMLSKEFILHQFQAYINLGVAGHLLKPWNQEMLKEVILTVSGYVAGSE